MLPQTGCKGMAAPQTLKTLAFNVCKSVTPRPTSCSAMETSKRLVVPMCGVEAEGAHMGGAEPADLSWQKAERRGTAGLE